MGSLGGLSVLSLCCLLDFFVDPLDQPPSIGYWELVVVIPGGHPEVVPQKEERLKHYEDFILRR